MSVVNIDIGIADTQDRWLCWSCVSDLQVSVNIGLRKKGFCDRCNSNPNYVYERTIK